MESPMRLPTKGKFEWNLNTVLQLITLCGMVYGGIYIWINTARDIDELQKWRALHEQYHKERLVEVKGIEVRVDERFKNVEGDIRKLSSASENITYRITANEQAVTTTSQTVSKIQDTLAQLGGDIRVVKEILQRIEAGQKKEQ